MPASSPQDANQLPSECSGLIEGRHSARRFLPQPVPESVLRAALTIARNAPSSKNTQPWKLLVVGGEPLQRLSLRLVELVRSGGKPSPDYQHSPNPLPDQHMSRARECGFGIFQLKGIERQDRAARLEHDLENFRFFGAPHAMILYLEKPPEGDCTKGNYLDAGMFLENLWLSLRLQGLEACAQYSVAGFPDVLREELGIPERTEIICGLAFGYEDPEALVNTYRTEKAGLDEFVRFIS